MGEGSGLCPAKNMKKRLLVFVALMMALMAMCATAMAYEDPVKIIIVMEKNFSEPQEVDAAITISNTSDVDLPGPLTLYRPDGTQVEEIGSPTLAAGSVVSCNIKLNVTEEQLQAGKVPFEMHYSIYGDEGEVLGMRKTVNKKVNYTGGIPSIKVDRAILPTTAANGQKVSVTYTVVNNGTLPVSNVEIKENKNISTDVGKIDALAPGEKATYTFTVTMKKRDLTSHATITYEAGGNTYQSDKEAATIKYGDLKLKGTLKADKKGGIPGDKVKLTLTLQNTGKEDFSGVSVSDLALGEVFSDQTVAAGKTLTLEKEVDIVDTVDYQFIIHATSSSGKEIDTATDRLTVKSVDPADVVNLEVEASVDHDVIYTMPGIVKFTVKVTNKSAADVKNVRVSASGLTLYTFDSLLPGETRSFVRDVKVEMVGRYQFVASVQDQLNDTQRFESNIIPISYSSPTPAPTEVPIEKPVQPNYEQIPDSVEVPGYLTQLEPVTRIGVYVCAVLAAIAGVLALIGIFRRATMNVGRPQDRLDVPSTRNYTEPSDDLDDEPTDPTADEPTEAPQDEDALPTEEEDTPKDEE